MMRAMLSVVAVIAGMGFQEPPTVKTEAVQEEKEKPETHEVKRGDLTLTIEGEGRFEPVDPQEVRLRFEVYSGELKIKSVAAAGAAVKAGDVVLELDPEPIRRQLESAELELDAARAALERAEEGQKLGAAKDALTLQDCERTLRESEEDLRYWDEVRGPHRLRRLEMGLQSYRDNVADQEDELDQLRKMYKTEDLTSATADIVIKRAVRTLERAKISLAMEEKEGIRDREIEVPKERVELSLKVDRARLDLEQLRVDQKQEEVGRRNGVHQARSARMRAEEQAEKLRKDRELFTVKASADGAVHYGRLGSGGWEADDPKSFVPGEKISADQIVLTIHVPGKQKFVMALPEAQIFWVQGKLSGRVTPVAKPEISYVALSPAAVRKGGAYELTAALPEIDPKLESGMKATLVMDAVEVKSVLLVPATSVSRGGVTVVGVDGKETRRDVGVGVSDGKMTEIRSGLKGGEKILLQPKK